jgi:putative tryptophan/tyrosine transport system substrate-binding protein
VLLQPLGHERRALGRPVVRELVCSYFSRRTIRKHRSASGCSGRSCKHSVGERAIHPIIAIWQQTRRIPIVLAMVPNPVEVGLIKSLPHPNENITGFTTFEYSIVGKWLEFLKAIGPGITRVGIMFNPEAYDRTLSPPQGTWLPWLSQFEAAAPSFAVEPVALRCRNLAEMRDALATFGAEQNHGLLIALDSFTVANYAHIVTLALQYRLPGCYPYRYFVTRGGLMSYGPNGADVFRHVASYVDRILRGAIPSDLPIQRPTKFELIINLKTATALGITIPPSIMVRADEVIE